MRPVAWVEGLLGRLLGSVGRAADGLAVVATGSGSTSDRARPVAPADLDHALRQEFERQAVSVLGDRFLPDQVCIALPALEEQHWTVLMDEVRAQADRTARDLCRVRAFALQQPLRFDVTFDVALERGTWRLELGFGAPVPAPAATGGVAPAGTGGVAPPVPGDVTPTAAVGGPPPLGATPGRTLGRLVLTGRGGRGSVAVAVRVGDCVTLGRQPGCGLVIDEAEGVDGVHAAATGREDGVDLERRDGKPDATRVNARPVSRLVRLSHGDVIEIGDARVVFEAQ